MTRKPIEPEKLVDTILKDRTSIREKLAKSYAILPEGAYSIPMAWRCAVRMSNKIVDAVPRYSSADHGSSFKSLLATVGAILAQSEKGFAEPFFDVALGHDETVEACFRGEYTQLAYLNLEVSLREQYWHLQYDPATDSFRLSLAPAQRRSALVLLDHKVEFQQLSPEVRDILRNQKSAKGTVPLLLATGMQEIKFLDEAIPAAWRDLASRIGFTVDESVRFLAFVQALMGTGHCWFRADDLFEGFTEFVKDTGIAPIARESFEQLVNFFSVAPETAASWGIAIPFVRFGDWFAYWPFVHHVLPPSLSFLSLLMRKHPRDWDNTVGTHLARVAESIQARLPRRPGLLFATTKRRSGIGEIDLAIYDSGLRVLLLCEIKTVFDRFRTNYQQSNFTGQKVNFAKAESQLAIAERAIANGDWQLSEVFGRKMDGQPARILSLVLTWYDQHNPWLGMTDSHPASCNFRVFEHLFGEAGGDLIETHEAISQLSRIYCVAALPPWRIPGVPEDVASHREVQTDLLPPTKLLERMPLSDFVRKVIKPLPKLPVDGEKQIRKMGQDAVHYHIYDFDEL